MSKEATTPKVRIVVGKDGRKDIVRSGSFLFGSLAPIPDEIAAEFKGALPGRPIPETGYMQDPHRSGKPNRRS